MASHSTRNLRSRKTAIKKKPSEASMMSSATKASNGSSGSNSTVTQESISRPKQKSKQDASKKAAVSRPSHRKISSRTSNVLPSVEEKLDVFQFLEKDDNEETDAVELEGANVAYQAHLEAISASSSSSSSSSSSREHNYPVNYQRPVSYQPYPDSYRHSWNHGSLPPGSFHSDSGISVRSNSPERDSQFSSPIKGKGRAGALYVQSAGIDGTGPRVLEPFDQSPEMSPEAYYSRPTFQHVEYDPNFVHLPCHRNLDLSHEMDGHQELEASEDSNISSHNLLANKVSADGNVAFKPFYRKFETLNNRVLLHLQDEISKLESQLHQLDKAISGLGESSEEDARSTKDGLSMSVGLEWQRKELVGRIGAMLDQYNRTLSSYSSICRHLDSVPTAEISAYKDWMEGHPPSGETESAFVHHEQDLITIPENCKASFLASERSAIATGSAMVMTIIAFRTIPELSSRLLVATVICLAMSYSGSASLTMDAQSLHEYGKRVVIYATAVVILAVTVG
ncbi:hypothetical protein MMC30_007309 [Trapelia coarctata]|nr:hypothetical protein [Trapelia coarctata]